jgi:ribosomal protein S18 acetylase RimI-like enzyme
MKPLGDKFEIRSGTKEDIEGLLDLFNEYWEAMTGVVKFTLNEFNTIFSTPGFDMESSLHVVTFDQDEIVASALVIDVGDPPIHPNVYGCVRKGFEGYGIGSNLLEWAEIRAREAIERCPEGARVSMHLQTTPSHKATVDLFERHHLRPVRFSWFMMRSLDGVLPVPIWTANIRIQSYKEYPDLETILKAVDDAFKDHWGHVDRSGDAERIERFRHSIESNEEFDPSLWYLAMDGDEIAGVALCNPSLGADKNVGVVDQLGVRRPWRRQGLALALLHQVFGEFQQRGYKQVGLGVDAQNLSGATRLYKKAGMQVTHEFAVYEKELRPGEELSKRS